MLENFLKTIKKEWALLEPLLAKGVKEKLIENNCEIDFKNEKIVGLPENLKFGIYLFKIIPQKTFQIDRFQEEWNSKKSPIKTPRIYPKRIELQKDSKENFNFYIGKSEKLSYRIKEHCFQGFNSTTYGLKLKHHKYLIENADFSVSFFELSNSKFNIRDKAIIQFVMTNLESELRNKYNPWIGKQ